jgi:hypothetical protein
MLPVRWMLPVGGVLFAITLLVLALTTPDGSRLQVSNVVSVRSGIIELGERPEWRQYIIVNAIQRRADELSRLRELPDTPIHTDAVPADSKTAGLPQIVPLDTADLLSIEFPVSAAPEEKPKAAPADAKIAGFPQTVPLDIADSLSIEFSVSAAPEQKPKSRNQAQVKSVRHVRRPVTALKPETPQAQNVVTFPFGSQTGYAPPFNSNSYFGNQSEKPSTPKANNHFYNQTWQTPTPNADIH